MQVKTQPSISMLRVSGFGALRVDPIWRIKRERFKANDVEPALCRPFCFYMHFKVEKIYMLRGLHSKP